MADAGDTLPLLGGSGGEKGSGAAEQNALPTAAGHSVEEHPGQHHGGTAAARAAAVDILPLQVVDQGAAVSQVFQVHPVPVEPVGHNVPAKLAQIAGDDQVVVRGLAARVLEVGSDCGVGGG